MSSTYSFKDLSGAITFPGIGSFSFFGQIGLGRLLLSNLTERTAQDVAADGSVMVSYISGDNAHLELEAQQTSDLHEFLLAAFNTLKSLADAGDVANWAAGQVTFRNLVDGTMHILNGVSFSKIPDKPYAAQGQRITWTLPVADSQQF